MKHVHIDKGLELGKKILNQNSILQHSHRNRYQGQGFSDEYACDHGMLTTEKLKQKLIPSSLFQRDTSPSPSLSPLRKEVPAKWFQAIKAFNVSLLDFIKEHSHTRLTWKKRVCLVRLDFYASLSSFLISSFPPPSSLGPPQRALSHLPGEHGAWGLRGGAVVGWDGVERSLGEREKERGEGEGEGRGRKDGRGQGERERKEESISLLLLFSSPSSSETSSPHWLCSSFPLPQSFPFPLLARTLLFSPLLSSLSPLTPRRVCWGRSAVQHLLPHTPSPWLWSARGCRAPAHCALPTR